MIFDGISEFTVNSKPINEIDLILIPEIYFSSDLLHINMFDISNNLAHIKDVSAADASATAAAPATSTAAAAAAITCHSYYGAHPSAHPSVTPSIPSSDILLRRATPSNLTLGLPLRSSTGPQSHKSPGNCSSVTMYPGDICCRKVLGTIY